MTGGWQYRPRRAALAKKGVPLDAYDGMIAAHALSLGLTLVTDNVKHFKRVPGLRVENWLCAGKSPAGRNKKAPPPRFR
jgi:tRNA(fMet)-specific endonuclease VapC